MSEKKGDKRWLIFPSLKWTPHVSFSELASKHGPIMTLWLGSMSTVVISSNEAAREMFKNHDVVLAGRKIYEAMKGDFGNEGSLITAQYGPHWRMLRRLCTTEFFVTSRLEALRGVSTKCIDHMVRYMGEAGNSGTAAIDVGRFFFLMSFNIIGNLMFSKDLLDPRSERGAKFFYHAGKVMDCKNLLVRLFPFRTPSQNITAAIAYRDARIAGSRPIVAFVIEQRCCHHTRRNQEERNNSSEPQKAAASSYNNKRMFESSEQAEGSNWKSSLCKTDVITTTPQQPSQV
ncbi:PREDICTED: cytochrome P450 76A2-like [Ipomoea nil]|uniref:cytochrome P450 76A2-like n=1 Tax=Ipomoea nil TaxID=35883 RepID=UPI0009017139|nr:PREDICTED: cytochrome P450 76A2-like [Ipomoea nil]